MHFQCYLLVYLWGYKTQELLLLGVGVTPTPVWCHPSRTRWRLCPHLKVVEGSGGSEPAGCRAEHLGAVLHHLSPQQIQFFVANPVFKASSGAGARSECPHGHEFLSSVFLCQAQSRIMVYLHSDMVDLHSAFQKGAVKWWIRGPDTAICHIQ